MQLFDIDADPNHNDLPYQGTVQYYGKVIPNLRADDYFDKLMQNIAWKTIKQSFLDEKSSPKEKWLGMVIRHLNIPIQISINMRLPWTKELLELKVLVESLTGELFNSCLLNLYHTGEEGMAWHSDDETDLKRDGAIASLSFGAEKKICI